jgi:hypothetical protein
MRLISAYSWGRGKNDPNGYCSGLNCSYDIGTEAVCDVSTTLKNRDLCFVLRDSSIRLKSGILETGHGTMLL